MLVEDNYFHTAPNFWTMAPCGCNAFAYNYITDEPYTSANWLSQIVFFHCSHSHYNLFEGNWCPAHYNDFTASSQYSHSRNNSYVRERMLGWDANGPKTANTNCLSCEAHHDNICCAACVMGHVGTQNNYNQIFNVDSTTNSTLLRLGNYNTVNGLIPAAEVTALGGNTVAASYLHSSKPTWFGDRPWPWCDPTNYAQSNDPTNFPAGYRASYGVDPPSDGTPPALPLAPTNLQVT
jgi:hypothetical protein